MTGVRVERIERDGSRWRVVCRDGSEMFDGVFSTIPISRTLECLGSGRIRPLDYRSVVVMYQEVRRREALPADWIYFPEDVYAFTRLFELNRFSQKRVSPDRSSITIEVPCAFGDGIWSMKEPDLAAMVREQLGKTGLFAAAELGGWELLKRRYVYPVQDHGSAVGIRENLEELRDYPGVFAAGRLGRFRYMNMDETLTSSWEAAEDALRTWSGGPHGR
jgi:protoporphyrinogen oxidase